ncbi:hypothetical protein MMPV_003814 [Pyropia vietnamensis]
MGGMRKLIDAGVHAQFVRRHLVDTRGAHGGAQFFPWHRALLVELEHALRTLIDPTLALGYWDWTTDADDPAASHVWNTTLLGGAFPGVCIPDGPFEGAMAQVETPHCVVRNFYARSSRGMVRRRFVTPAFIGNLVSNGEDSWDDFTAVAERIHGDVHVAVGASINARPVGDMLPTSISPNDPAFFAHHAFVDAWWADRQSLIGNDYTGFHRQRAVSPDDRLDVFDSSVRDILDLPCVTYAPPVVALTPEGRGFAPDEASGGGPPVAFNFNSAPRVDTEAVEAARDAQARGVGMDDEAIAAAKAAVAAVAQRVAARGGGRRRPANSAAG